MTALRMIQVPYHLGREHVGLAAGVPVLAAELGGDGDEIIVERGAEFTNEIAASMQVIRRLAASVRTVVKKRAIPLVLAGNCNSSLGTVAGLGAPDDLAVVWLDAHADFHSPETTTSGFFDGLALAMLTGTGFDALRRNVEGLRPVPPKHVVLVGARDLDPAEEERLGKAHVARVRPGERVEPTLDALPSRLRSVYVHVDLDVLDPWVGRANWFAVEGGLTLEQVQNVIDAVGSRLRIRAAALTAYAPECDPERAIPAAARKIADRIAVSAGAELVTT